MMLSVIHISMTALWLAAMIVLLIVEALVPGLVSIWFALGALAAIIASQALITGSYTLVSEAIRLDLMPQLGCSLRFDVKAPLQRDHVVPAHIDMKQ